MTRTTIAQELISANALKVIQRLEDEGFSAYLVGGGVRDILLGEHPKDFDISTDATPEQVRGVFRNSRIIGRRFRIVHVLFGREMIEVTTFRGHHPEGKDDGAGPGAKHAVTSDSGRLLRDNVYGSIEEDALRRDFTVNALYYHPASDEILDFCGGLEDLKQRRLRLIGDPPTRYREDPVRMLRAVRFSAKLGFELSPEAHAPIAELAPLLNDIPPARMFDEVLKLLMSAYALDTFHALRQQRLFEFLFPSCENILGAGDDISQRFVEAMLRNTQLRIQQGKPVTPAFLYGALLWPAVRSGADQLMASGEPPIQARLRAGIGAIEAQLSHTSIPRRFSTPMREIWDLQYRLQHPRGAEKLVALPRFRAAYDFLVLREEAGEETSGMGAWWTQYQDADETERAGLRSELQPSKGRRRRKPRKPRRNASPKLADPAP